MAACGTVDGHEGVLFVVEKNESVSKLGPINLMAKLTTDSNNQTKYCV